jgi:hypothetical protein
VKDIEPAKPVDVGEIALQIAVYIDPIVVDVPEPIPATLCDLVNRPGQYNGRMVQVRASMAAGLESLVLLDETCSGSIWLSVGEKPASGKLEYADVHSVADILAPEKLDWRPCPSRGRSC